MAKKRARPQKKKRPKSTNGGSLKTNLIRIFAGIFVLILLVVVAGVVTRHLMLRPKPLKPVEIQPTVWPPKFEIYPPEVKPFRKPIAKPAPRPADQLPKVAIIIDDIGYDRQIADKFLELNANITFSMLPYNSMIKSFARKAQEKGFDIMLHLPMEPNEYPQVDPGPGGLLTSMSPDELIRQLKKDLDAVPGIKGVNNHMGSKMTTVSTQMYQIFTVLKEKGLFFIDSRTTPDSLCRPSARLFRLPFAQRDVFIDHVQDRKFIRRQIDQLIHIAYEQGEAVGIAHPHTLTYDVLRQELPDLQKKVRLVPASQVVHPIS